MIFCENRANHFFHSCFEKQLSEADIAKPLDLTVPANTLKKSSALCCYGFEYCQGFFSRGIERKPIEITV